MPSPQGPGERPTHEGAVVYRVAAGVVRYLVVASKDTPPQWVWPTGHIEPGIDRESGDAAIREVKEETGVTAERVAPLSRRAFNRRDERSIIDYFLCRFVAESAVHEPRSTAWLTFAEAQAALAHQESRDLLDEAQPKITAQLSGEG